MRYHKRVMTTTSAPPFPLTVEKNVVQAPPEDEETVLHVIIAHDDHAAYVRAVRMLANTFFGSPEARGLRPLPWKFEELHSEERRKSAIADAPRTDVFVVSASHCDQLPEGVALWLSECFVLRQNTPTAVIALGASPDGTEAPWRTLLREATVAAGLDFLEASAPSRPAAD